MQHSLFSWRLSAAEVSRSHDLRAYKLRSYGDEERRQREARLVLRTSSEMSLSHGQALNEVKFLFLPKTVYLAAHRTR